MIQNYENVLIKLYDKYQISKNEAIHHHNAGLELFLKQIRKIKKLNLTGSAFLQAMDQADKEWDMLMQNFVPHEKAQDLES